MQPNSRLRQVHQYPNRIIGNIKPQKYEKPVLNFTKSSELSHILILEPHFLILAALEMLVEISNVRASLLRAHEQVQKDLNSAK